GRLCLYRENRQDSIRRGRKGRGCRSGTTPSVRGGVPGGGLALYTSLEIRGAGFQPANQSTTGWKPAPRHFTLQGDPIMRTRTTLVAAALLAVGVLLGWLTPSGGLPTALAQGNPKAEVPPNGATPSVLPRPDFHFPGNVGRTYLDPDPPQFPQPVQ